MKKVFLLLKTIFVFSIVYSQQGVAINTDGSVANSSALLDIKSNNKGVLIPRMTTAKKMQLQHQHWVYLFIKRIAQQVFIITMEQNGLLLILQLPDHLQAGPRQEMLEQIQR